MANGISLRYSGLMKIILTILLCCFCLFGIAKANAFIKLPAYYTADCEDYTGTWQGFMTNPNDIVPDNAHVTLQLLSKGNAVVGEYNHQPFWASCKNGVLNNIFVGEKNHCGKLSQQGLLVSKNALVVAINKQSAMMDWTLLLFLHRTSTNVSFTPPHNTSLGDIRSCH